MKTAKEEVRELLDRLPEDVPLEVIQCHISVCRKDQKALDDDYCILLVMIELGMGAAAKCQVILARPLIISSGSTSKKGKG